MLETLRIQNYALIDELEVDFSDGFNVLTGETGAGKSIIVGGLNLILGARASSDAVRKGAKMAKVDAVFRLTTPSKRLGKLLAEREIELEDGELILSRTVTAEGRSRAYVLGNLVPASVLAGIGDELVDLHGQHEHQSLLKTERQLDLLDGFGRSEKQVEEVASLVGRLREVEREIAELESDDREQTRRVDFLKYEVEEINGAHLAADEEEELRGRRNLLTNAERIFQLANTAYNALYDGDDGSAIGGLGTALSAIEELAGIDERFRPYAGQLVEARTAIEEVSGDIRAHTEQVDFDPAELDVLNERLNVLTGLKRKYGANLAEVLAYRDKAMAEIQAYASRDQVLAKLRQQAADLSRQAHEAAGKLTRKRKTAAKKLDKQVSEALQALGMKGGAFNTQFDEGQLTLTGIDRVEFLLAANPGESLKPLRQVASGGEISRIMLALKSVFAGADKIPTLIFDEIDAGVGGQTAKQVAGKLGELAQSHQTICITHLAQIAAVANTHYHVAKASRNGKTSTTMTHVEGKARIEELARILDGSLTKVSLEHARALLEGTPRVK